MPSVYGATTETTMPFRSAKQRRYMFARHPTIAKRWAKKYGAKIRRRGKKNQ